MTSRRSRTLEFSVVADIQDLQRKLNQAGQQTEGFATKLSAAGSTLTRNVTLPLAGLGVVATKAASDLGESVNAVNVVFGEAADQIHEFGKTSAEAVGLSARAFNNLVVPLGSVFQNFGDSADEAARKSIELTQRAADMASVFNVDVTEALTAIQAALRGEADPIERFGVSVNAAAVEAKALALGLAETKSQITDADKATARYALILEQTARVSGDFANTSDQLANQTRILKADAEDLAAEFGEALLPIMATVVDVVGDAADAFGNLSPETQETVVQMALLAAAAGPAAKVLGGVATAATGLGTAIKGLNLLVAGAGGLVPALKALGAAAAPVAAIAGVLVAVKVAADEFGDGLVDLRQDMEATRRGTDEFRKSSEDFKDAQRDAAEEVEETAKSVGRYRNEQEQAIFLTRLQAQEQEELNRVFSRFRPPPTDGFGQAAEEVSRLRSELGLLANEQRALVDPIFRLRQAEDQLTAAQRARVEAQTSGAPRRQTDDAILAEIQAFQDLQFAREDASGVFEDGFGILERYAAEAGIAAENIRRIRDETAELDRALRGLPTDPFAGITGGVPVRELERTLVRRNQQVVE